MRCAVGWRQWVSMLGLAILNQAVTHIIKSTYSAAGGNSARRLGCNDRLSALHSPGRLRLGVKPSPALLMQWPLNGAVSYWSCELITLIIRLL